MLLGCLWNDRACASCPIKVPSRGILVNDTSARASLGRLSALFSDLVQNIADISEALPSTNRDRPIVELASIDVATHVPAAALFNDLLKQFELVVSGLHSRSVIHTNISGSSVPNEKTARRRSL